MDCIYSEEYYLGKEPKISIVSDDMIADIIGNKNIDQIITDLFIRGIKFNISLVFVIQGYQNLLLLYKINFRLNSAQFLL